MRPAPRHALRALAFALALATAAGCATGRHPDRATAHPTPCLSPIQQTPLRISSAFHDRGGQHNGIDIPAPKGTPVYATADGIVLYAGKMDGYGRIIRIGHGNGIETRYAHLKSRGVKAGKHVTAGAQIGKVGKSGRATGCHLHYEIRINGQPTNPAAYLKR